MELKKISGKPTYIPARLAKKKDRWEIIYYQTNPVTGKRGRHRETWDLNRIKNLKTRGEEAKKAVAEVNRLLPHGYPFLPAAEIDRRLNSATIYDAIEQVVKTKQNTDRYETKKDVRSIGGVFLRWLQESKLASMPAEMFTRKHALQFLDAVAARRTRDGKPIGPRTWNNYRNKTGSLFIMLIEREVIQENPFAKIKRKPVDTKKRRKFLPVERVEVARWLYDHDYLCFLAITLQYYCLLRGTELRRLCASDFKMDKGLIYLQGSNSKTGKERWITIPDQLVPFLEDERFKSIPGSYLVFGAKGKPHPNKCCGRSYIWRHLKKCLDALVKAGKLTDIDGLSPYSFKDTGITEWLEKMPVPSVMRQAGHTNPATTMIYYQPDPVNPDFKAASSIFDATPEPDRSPIGDAEQDK